MRETSLENKKEKERARETEMGIKVAWH